MIRWVVFFLVPQIAQSQILLILLTLEKNVERESNLVVTCPILAAMKSDSFWIRQELRQDGRTKKIMNVLLLRSRVKYAGAYVAN